MRLLLLIAAVVVPLAAAAQPAQPGRLAFVTLAAGASSGSTGNTGNPLRVALPSVAVDLHVVRGPLHAQAGASAQAAPFETDAVVEGHLLAGTSAATGPAVVTVAAGPSLAYVSRARYGTPESPVTGYAGTTEGLVPGAYGSVGATVVLVPEVGLGIEAFGHLNARMPVAGLRLTAALGRLPRSAVR